MKDDTQAADAAGGWPETLSPEVMQEYVKLGTGQIIVDDLTGRHEFRFHHGGPIYGALTGEQLTELPQVGEEDADLTREDILGQYTEGFETDEAAAAAGVVHDIPGDDDPDADEEDEGEGGEEETEEDAFDDDQQEEIEAGYCELLDDLKIPPIVTQEDLAAAGLEAGPSFTHSEAMLAAVSAANAAAPEFEVEADLGEALYEFGFQESWPPSEAFWRRACELSGAEAGDWLRVDPEIRLWFIVFSKAGQALEQEARYRIGEYMNHIATLKRELETTRYKQKLADRRETRRERAAARPAQLKRAAEKWRKTKTAQERKAKRRRERASPAPRR